MRHRPDRSEAGTARRSSPSSGRSRRNYEQLLVNSLGPVELWALSTTPGDTSSAQPALRRRSASARAAAAVEGVPGAARRRRRSSGVASNACAAARWKRERPRACVEGLAAEVIDGRGVALALGP